MVDKKIALITGANKGLGYETARQLANHNVKVLIGAWDATRGQEAVEKLENEGFDAEFVLVDVTDKKTLEAAVKHVEETYGKLDILINNAGIAVEYGADPGEVEGASIIFDLATLSDDGATGGHFDDKGVVPW